MRRASPAFHDLGRRLLEHEAGGRADAAGLVVAAEMVLLKLQPWLIAFFGRGGFDRLLARALYLAKTEPPLLAAVVAEPTTEGLAGRVHLRGLREGAAHLDPTVVATALVALIGSLIWLLATFIGRDMVLAELRTAWPALPFPAGDISEEDKGD